jgi:hypothetical protein
MAVSEWTASKASFRRPRNGWNIMARGRGPRPSRLGQRSAAPHSGKQKRLQSATLHRDAAVILRVANHYNTHGSEWSASRSGRFILHEISSFCRGTPLSPTQIRAAPTHSANLMENCLPGPWPGTFLSSDLKGFDQNMLRFEIHIKTN